MKAGIELSISHRFGFSRSTPMRIRTLALAAASLCLAAESGAAQQLDLSRYRMVDLTHPFNEHTLYWPTSPTSFHLERLAWGATPGGYFYSANAYSAPEHGGTHMDAPIHFGEGQQTVDQVPLEHLVAPAVVIDVSARADADHDYRLTPDDVTAWESEHGRITPGTIVLLRTGWSRFYGDRAAYFGNAQAGTAANLHFPSFGEDAVRLLVEQRGAAVIGVDVPSIDYGPSTAFLVHRVVASHNVPGLENLTNLDQLPARGAVVIALPMKIEGGSGGPLRAIALVPR
jgi:kynurenine formamidase